MPKYPISIMKKFILSAICVCLLVLLSSCAAMNPQYSENYEMVLDTWVGEKIGRLVNAWGYPIRKFMSPSGRKVYVYEQSQIIRIPQSQPNEVSIKRNFDSTFTVTEKTKYNNIELYCVTWIETNSAGDIVNWRWEGNDCTAGDLQ